MKTCLECGRPMEKPEDFAGGDIQSEICVQCGAKGVSAEERKQELLRRKIRDHLVEKRGMTQTEAEEAIRRWEEEHAGE
jgi:predicted  nucleic acid-binding Zn-ribbon protein